MPNGPLFSDQPVASSVIDCLRQTKAAGTKKWSVPGVLKILCKNDKNIVEQLRNTTVKTADRIDYYDPYFNGRRWTTKRFEAAGVSNAAEKLIRLSTDASNEEAVDTIYHEIWHQNQPPGMGWPEPAEDDAFYHTEKWLIERGLPGDPRLRMKDTRGRLVPNKKAIRNHVQKMYPSPPPPVAGKQQPVPIEADVKKNLTKVRDPVTLKTWWRPSQAGDTFASDTPIEVNPKTIDKSAWKCS
jgi:hypothetical protein